MLKINGFGRMKILCNILDKKEIAYDWYVLGSSYKEEEFEEITSWFTNNKNVHFLGYKQNVYQYIKQMDYLALLTDRESWGLVITEALILGVPCIATNFAGVEKQIINNENGIIIGMENCNNEYEKKIEDVLNLKKQLKNNIKGKNYNREHIITAWLNLLGN